MGIIWEYDDDYVNNIIIGRRDDGYVYAINKDGEELGKFQLPEKVSLYSLEICGNKLFYTLRDGEYFQAKEYVSTIDEIRGRRYISNLDGSDIKELDEETSKELYDLDKEEYTPDLALNENARYGIIVRNDGKIRSYRNPNRVGYDY